MSDFVEFRPRSTASPRIGSDPRLTVRAAVLTDVRDLANVRSARGGTFDDQLEASRRSIERSPMLLVAETENKLVGWCGAEKISIRPEDEPQWLIAGLTVIPDYRRRGIAARLLGDVVRAVQSDEDVVVFSAINARNLASIALHHELGFREVARRTTIARIEFAGGEGVLLRHAQASPHSWTAPRDPVP